MKFSVLSSGSRANCTYFEAADTRILIDCGLSARQTVMRLRYLGIEPSSLDAILITHEHSDHVYGVSVMSRRFGLPVYANRATARHLAEVYAVEHFVTGEEFSLDNLAINPFSVDHDAADPVAFSIRAEGQHFAQVTDLGQVTPLVQDSIRQANALVVESNHDYELLHNCGYPWYLVQRIISSQGHLSNDSSAQLVAGIMHSDLRHLVLGHLSENSNRPDLALNTLFNHIEASPQRTIACASAAKPTPVFEL